MMFVPKLMATQHPDSTVKVSCLDEVLEAIEAYMKFHCDEVMIDYEGKLTPYHQIEWIIEKAREYNIDIGKVILLTPRIPRDDLEDVSRHVMSLVGALLANAKAYRYGLELPVRYVIIPMTENIRDAIRIQQRLLKLEKLLGEEIGYSSQHYLIVIPLIETVERQIHADAVAEAFHRALIKEATLFIDTMRIFLGKSDSALHSGHIASSLSLKIAINKLFRWSEEKFINVKIILGMGKPPFRGHLALHNIDTWIENWKSYSTVTIQSALRYDTDYSKYIEIIEKLLNNVDTKPNLLDVDTERALIKIILQTTPVYRRNLINIVKGLKELFNTIPSMRERIAYQKYGRNIERIVVPRAIRFTAACYTAGIPPTLLDIESLVKMSSKDLDIILSAYPGILKDLMYDISFFNPEIASKYIPIDIVKTIERSINALKRDLGIEGNVNIDEEYWKYASIIANKIHKHIDEEIVSLIVKLAKIRGFLG